MTKKIQDEGFGVTRLFLGWIPQERHLRQNIPICFTAETNERYVEGTFTVIVVVVVLWSLLFSFVLHFSQSEMRCVVVVVAKALALTG